MDLSFCFTISPVALLYWRPPVAISCFLRFYLPLCLTNALRGLHLSLHVFTNLSTKPTTSGGTIFLCLKKDSGERQTKGPRPRWIPGVMFWRKSDVLCACRLATVFLTRLSRLRRCRLSPRLCVLRPDGDAKRHRRKYPWGAPRRRGFSIAVGSALGVRCG